MDATDKLAILSTLSQDFCCLNHGPGTAIESYPAVNCLCIPTTEGDLTIPVCQECQDALAEDQGWTLLYCLDCAKSQWIFRAKARMMYRHRIIWLRGCPTCAGEHKYVFFQDPIEEA